MSYSTPTLDELRSGTTAPVIDANGEKLGHVGEIWMDDETGEPEYLKVGRGFLGMKATLVPVRGGHFEEDGFHTQYTKDQLENAPEFEDEDDDIDEMRSGGVRDYYADHEASATSMPDTASRDEGSITRSEEELGVGKRETSAGSVKLRKYVDTEPVQANVELTRETARVVREDIDQPVGDATIGEQEIDVTLRREEAVVEKQVVGKERISIDKDVEVEQTTVSDEVRKERVEIEGDDDLTARR